MPIKLPPSKLLNDWDDFEEPSPEKKKIDSSKTYKPQTKVAIEAVPEKKVFIQQ